MTGAVMTCGAPLGVDGRARCVLHPNHASLHYWSNGEIEFEWG